MDLHHRAKALFLEVRELPEAERAAWLQEACGEDVALRAEIESLLAAEEGMATDFLGHGVRPRLSPGSTVSRYRILKPLGTGGMGEVWLAEQREPVRRRVALKIVKWGLSSDEVLARFEAERQALALMVHPGIAQVYDAGTTADGRPYFAMEYVPGIPITDYCDRCQLNLRRRLDLFREVCRAVQHAHQKGVIHRDLKPGNVLVAEVDGEPQAKVIDFGVAKATSKRLTERSLYTELNVLIGTPEYMSPEQADPGTIEVDTRSDIYSLGAILYKLLTGQLPFDDKRLREVGYEEMLRILREEEPPRLDRRLSTLGEEASTVAQARNTDPGTLVRALRGDLDWVVAKALRKEPERRYMTVTGLIADLDRYLDGRTVEARPDTLTYRAGRFLTRHRIGATAAALLLALLVAYAVTATVQARALSRERDRAQAEAAKAQEVTSFVIDLFETADPENALGESLTARDLIDRGAARVGKELAGEPELLAPLLAAVGEIYQRLGDYEEADSILRRALAAARESSRPKLEAEVLHELGNTLVERYELDAAEPVLKQALAARRRLLGEQDPLVAETLERLARLHLYRGELEEAEVRAREGLALLQAAGGGDTRLTAWLLDALGNILQGRADYRGAEQAHREALAIYRRLLPEQHPDIATTQVNLAVLLRTIGRHDESARLYREAVATYRNVLGENHPWVDTALEGLASTLHSQGDFEGAEALHRQVLEAREKALGERHRLVALAMNEIGRSIQAQGRLAEAEEYYRRALVVYPEEDPGRATTLLNLATVLEARGDLEGAEAIYRQRLAEEAASLGEDHDRVALRRAFLGGVLVRRGRHEEAEPLLRRALDVFRAKLPEDHPWRAYALTPLGYLLCERGDVEEGEPHLVAGLRLRQHNYGSDDLRTAEAALALGSCLAATGQTDVARRHLTDAYRTFEAAGDPRSADSHDALAALKSASGE